MAQRDLDAALQLLANRAQYITGATGAAIALRRSGRNDMLCRASAGANAPEVGSLLSTEHGLSGESVRTRQPLRCDDAERDARVNRDACRRMGIASVVVMPVVNDDEILGVFELFSGRVNAFGERDLSAVQRLSQMVETAVRLAKATESLPEKLREAPPLVESENSKPEEQILETQPGLIEVASGEEQILDEEIFVAENVESGAKAAGSSVDASGKPEPEHTKEASTATVAETQSTPVPAKAAATASTAATVSNPVSAKTPLNDTQSATSFVQQTSVNREKAGQPETSRAPVPSPASATPASMPQKPLFWSAASTAGEAPAESDQSHVPPVLRGLRKCEACGFPITDGRVLCVECEEKKWRGQLKRSQPMPTGVIPASSKKPEAQAFAAAAQGAPSSGQPSSRGSSLHAATSTARPALQPEKPKQPIESGELSVPSFPSKGHEVQAEAPALSVASGTAIPVFSAGLEPPQSWFSRNKYVLGVLLVAAAGVVAFILSH